MKKTPEDISKARQKLKNEIDTWKKAIFEAENDPQISSAATAEAMRRVTYAQSQIAECARELKKMRKQGKRQFWK